MNKRSSYLIKRECWQELHASPQIEHTHSHIVLSIHIHIWLCPIHIWVFCGGHFELLIRAQSARTLETSTYLTTDVPAFASEKISFLDSKLCSSTLNNAFFLSIYKKGETENSL